MERWSAPGRSKPTFEEAVMEFKRGNAEKVEKGYEFGPSCEYHSGRDENNY
jgi:hypothetical protein